MWSKDTDDVSQDDVNAGREKSRAKDESGDLDFKGQITVDALGGPGTSYPAEKFTDAAEDENQ